AGARARHPPGRRPQGPRDRAARSRPGRARMHPSIEFRILENGQNWYWEIISDREVMARGVADSTNIPIIFTTGLDLVLSGLVKNLARPDANVTGASFYSGGALFPKQIHYCAS